MIPSRSNNPFATCWTRPGAIPFRFAEGQSVDTVVAKLARQKWRGAIIGPHGSGKSTLLATLGPYLRAAEKPVCVIDGYERLGRLARSWQQMRCQLLGRGLVVTSHSPTNLPTLIELSTTLPLVQELAIEIGGPAVSADDVAASFARRGGNVREIFFDLYDQYEHLRRPLANGSTGRRVTKVSVTAP